MKYREQSFSNPQLANMWFAGLRIVEGKPVVYGLLCAKARYGILK